MSFDFSHVDFNKGLSQMPKALKILLGTPGFIAKHKLWRGVFDNTWILIFSIITAVLFTYLLYDNIHDFNSPNNNEGIEISINSSSDPNETAQDKADVLLTTGLEEKSQDSAGQEEEDDDDDEKDDEDYDEEDDEEEDEDNNDDEEDGKAGHKPLFSGSLKFLLLIFLEVIIFHFAVKTNNILKNDNKIPAVKDFTKAQVRIFKVMGRKWIYGLIMYGLVSVICTLTNTQALKDSIMFMIYGYYMGFAFLDNYLEQFKFSINESAQVIQGHFGASLIFGLFTSIVINIPIIGPLVVPFICGIAATRYGHEYNLESFPIVAKA